MGWFITIVGIVLIGIGTFFTFYGQHINSQKISQNNYASIKTSIKILKPKEEKLLSLIYKHQRKLGVDKLIIIRENGNLLFDDERKKKKYDINFIRELFDVEKGFEKYQKEFESIMLSIPNEYLRHLPETRFDSPFVLQITEEGIKYLNKN